MTVTILVCAAHFVFSATALKITPLRNEPEYLLAAVMSTNVTVRLYAVLQGSYFK